MAQWELARIEIRPHLSVPHSLTWSPPRGGFRVFGVRFSLPTEIYRIHIAHRIVAINDWQLVERYGGDVLQGAYVEWRPKHVSEFAVELGSTFQVDMLTVYPVPGFVDLLHEMPDDAPRKPSLAEARRARRIDDCRRSLGAKLPPPDVLAGVALDIQTGKRR